jgi:predicted Zn-dependent protease
MTTATTKRKTRYRWYRYRWLKRSGYTPWLYREQAFSGLLSRDAANLRTVMEERVEEEAAIYGRANAQWNFVKPKDVPDDVLCEIVASLRRAIEAADAKIKRIKNMRKAIR